MPDTISIADPYRVKHGDTLSAIAQRCGRTISELTNFNKITNPNQLKIGQVLYLSKETAFGVSFLFLDTLRYPIENLPYRLQFDDQTTQGITDQMGAVIDKITTRNALSKVEVWIKNADNQWQRVTATVSGYGHKLITLVSGFVVFKGQTELLPDGAPPKPILQPPTPPKPNGPQAPMPPRPTGDPSNNNPDLKHKKHKGPQGQSVITVGVDIPEGLMQLFQNYTGEEITEGMWDSKAKELQCEKEVLKAFAQVESKGAAFKRINSHNHSGIIPTILYERHIFHRLTCANGPSIYKTDLNTGKYLRDAHGNKIPNHGKHVLGCLSPHDKYPDICYPSQFVGTVDKKGHATLHTDNSRMPDGKVEESDQYGKRSYLRLINAYRLDNDAALSACSWGKFQVMGAEHQTSGRYSIKQFMDRMCTSEVKQLEILQSFIRNKAGGLLLQAVREKDWNNMALYYNGSGDVATYSSKLKNTYEKLKKDTA